MTRKQPHPFRVVSEMLVGNVIAHILTDGEDTAWLIYGPAGQILCVSQPLPFSPDQIEPVVRSMAVALSRLYLPPH